MFDPGVDPPVQPGQEPPHHATSRCSEGVGVVKQDKTDERPRFVAVKPRLELMMTEDAKLSLEGQALAEAFGAMLSGFAFELHLKANMPRPTLVAALGRGLKAIETNRNLEAPQEIRDAIAAAIRRTAVI